MSTRSNFTLWFAGSGDPDHFSATVSAGGFTGATEYVVFQNQMRDFLGGLVVFPILKPAVLTIGAEFNDGPLLALTVEPADGRGGLRVKVHLAADNNRARSVSTDFLCVHSDVERFAREVKGCLQSGGAATLYASTT